MPEGRVMGRWIGVLVCALLSVAAITAASAASPATPSSSPTAFDCPISRPSGKQPPEIADLGCMDGIANDALWVSLVMWSEQPGIVEVPNDSHLLPDGTVQEMKWAWYRYAAGKLTIEGHRLDAPAPPLIGEVPDGYGLTGFQVSGITFPTDGCWEITGHLGDAANLTIVVLVKYPQGFAPEPPATPAATPSDCPITQPNGIQPPPDANVFGRGSGDYGNDVLWTSLWIWGDGVVQVPDDGRILPDGTIPDMKWAWYRFVPGHLTITGRRLDAPAPPLQGNTSGYGETGFNASGITFPTDGCWEITGTVGDKGSLNFIVQVI
jgi:hypothetical protein